MIRMLCDLSKRWKVNCSMTYKRLLSVGLMLLLSCLVCRPVYADEAIDRSAPLIPLGEVLIVYSDGASDAEVAAVSDMVEILTYQSFQVSYGTATQAFRAVKDFDYVICYEVDKYPAQFPVNLAEGQKNGLKIFFIGDQLIKDYVEKQADYSYVVEKKNVETSEVEMMSSLDNVCDHL